MSRSTFEEAHRFNNYHDYVHSMSGGDGMVDFVCKICKVRPEKIRHKTKKGEVAMARQLICWAFSTFTSKKPEEIGSIVGKNRTLTYYAIKKCHEADEGYNPELLDKMRLVRMWYTKNKKI